MTEKLKMRERGKELGKWEAGNQGALKNMVRVIGEIREIVKLRGSVQRSVGRSMGGSA